jgi:hypothetical protein
MLMNIPSPPRLVGERVRVRGSRKRAREKIGVRNLVAMRQGKV